MPAKGLLTKEYFAKKLPEKIFGYKDIIAGLSVSPGDEGPVDDDGSGRM